MPSDGDMGGPSAVPGMVRPNGSTSASQEEGESTITTNGSFKTALMTNGGSFNGEKHSSPGSARSTSYFGHNREEVTRILIQALADMGYQTAADSVSQESGYSLENQSVSALRTAVLDGAWADAEQLLSRARASDAPEAEGNGLILAPGSDMNQMKFCLRQQKFLELLEQRDTARALMTLRGELTPLNQESSTLHFLSSLLMCTSIEDLMDRANWDGAKGQSRKKLLSALSRCISPSVMLPETRLAVLLQHVKQSQINACLYHTAALPPSLYSDHICERRNFPSEVVHELSELGGEVWQVTFSHDGTKIAACGSRDIVMIWDTTTFSPISTLSGHGKDGGVSNVVWSPDDSMLVTCSFDRYARLWDTKKGALLKRTKRFDEPVSGCVWASDSKTFVLGSLDKNHGLCTLHVDDDEVLEWNKKHRVQDMCGSPDERTLVAVDDLNTIHVYDAHTRELEYDLELTSRPTSVSISQDSRHLLVNNQTGEAQLIDLSTRLPVQKFVGHSGGNYLIRSAFGGANESFVISGSEDGHVMIWHKNLGVTVDRLPGHVPRCNSVSWNPTDPCMLASCGDDGRVKIYTNRRRASEMRTRFSSGSNGWRNENS